MRLEHWWQNTRTEEITDWEPIYERMKESMLKNSMYKYAEFLIAHERLRNNRVHRNLMRYAELLGRKRDLTPDESIRQAIDEREDLFKNAWKNA